MQLSSVVRQCSRACLQRASHASLGSVLTRNRQIARTATRASFTDNLRSCTTGQTEQIRTLFGQSFDISQIEAVQREDRDVGTRPSMKARSAGLLPGRLYGIDADGRKHHINLWVRYDDLKREYNKRKESFENTLFDLKIDGVTYRVLPRDLKKHPVQKKALSCDWLIYVAGRNPGYRVSIPTRTMNEERCVAFKQGGWLLDVLFKVPVYAYGDHIPDVLMLDLRGKKVGDTIMMSELHLPDGLVPRHTDDDFAIAKLVGSRRLGAATQAS